MCTSAHGPPPPPIYPHAIESAFPANGMFLSYYTLLRDGAQVMLAPDAEAAVRLAVEARRPVTALAAGDVLRVTAVGTTPCRDAECDGYRIVVAGADTTPPTVPEVSSVRTLLVRDPAGEGFVTCPDTDTLELTIAVSDDATLYYQIGFVAYIAPTEAELAATTTPAIAFGYDGSNVTTATIALGGSVGRQRDGSPFLGADPYCFAIAAFDRAGNLSARSSATCLDTRDETDPTVQFVESSAGCCSSHHAASGDWLAVLAVALVLTRARRRPDHARCRR